MSTEPAKYEFGPIWKSDAEFALENFEIVRQFKGEAHMVQGSAKIGSNLLVMVAVMDREDEEALGFDYLATVLQPFQMVFRLSRYNDLRLSDLRMKMLESGTSHNGHGGDLAGVARLIASVTGQEVIVG